MGIAGQVGAGMEGVDGGIGEAAHGGGRRRRGKGRQGGGAGKGACGGGKGGGRRVSRRNTQGKARRDRTGGVTQRVAGRPPGDRAAVRAHDRLRKAGIVYGAPHTAWYVTVWTSVPARNPSCGDRLSLNHSGSSAPPSSPPATDMPAASGM